MLSFGGSWITSLPVGTMLWLKHCANWSLAVSSVLVAESELEVFWTAGVR